VQKYAKTNDKDDKKSKYECEYKSEYESDWEIHRQYVNTFDPLEAMLIGQVYDSVSNSVDGSKITDSYASTLAKERADRVVAKLPDGVTEAVGKADVGKAAFMDILRQKWIYPNANAQHPFLEKLNMWQLYSSVYGYMPMFYDWNVAPNGYIGPDCWLWNPRNLVPQQGRTSITDMDYVNALTWVGEKSLEAILENEAPETQEDGWDRDALAELVEMSKDQTTDSDSNKDTLVERNRISGGTKKGICLVTRYEAGEEGEWVTFAPDHSYVEVRRIKNPHKNGRIPFVIKYSQPLFDSFYGLGDFQRAKPLQFARDGLTNFYFASLKRNLSPGIIVNTNGVVKHTLDVTAPNPVLMETIPNSIRPMPTNTAGLSTYQGAMSNLTGSLLSQFGTGNASIPGAEALNPSQGKTPAAVNMYSDKEATRDGAERLHLEQAIEQLMDGFFSLIANIGTEEIPVDLFYEDIQDIAKAGLEDVLGLFKEGTFQMDGTQTAGTLKIDPASLKGVEYRFNVNTGSTAKQNVDKQMQNFQMLMDNIGKFQNIFKDDPRLDVHLDKMVQALGSLIDIPNANEFVTFDQSKPSAEEQQMQMKQQEMEAAQQQHDQQMQQQEMQMQVDANKPPEPQNVGGRVFNDPEIAAVAQSFAQ